MNATATATEVAPATEPMRKLIDTLLVERVHINLTDDLIVSIKGNKPQAHRFITFLLAQPKAATPAVPVEPVPAPALVRNRLNFAEITDGNYAVRTDGIVKFYRVTTNKKGYKEVQVRASDALHLIMGKGQYVILHQIVDAGLAESRMLFAQELGRCWRCGKSLTDEESRARGMGPDCAGK